MKGSIISPLKQTVLDDTPSATGSNPKCSQAVSKAAKTRGNTWLGAIAGVVADPALSVIDPVFPELSAVVLGTGASIHPPSSIAREIRLGGAAPSVCGQRLVRRIALGCKPDDAPTVAASATPQPKSQRVTSPASGRVPSCSQLNAHGRLSRADTA